MRDELQAIEGMTLRDYFAAKAMQQMTEYLRSQDYGLIDETAAMAYRYADAMLKAREQ
jgi:hypothetical protein